MNIHIYCRFYRLWVCIINVWKKIFTYVISFTATKYFGKETHAGISRGKHLYLIRIELCRRGFSHPHSRNLLYGTELLALLGEWWPFLQSKFAGRTTLEACLPHCCVTMVTALGNTCYSEPCPVSSLLLVHEYCGTCNRRMIVLRRDFLYPVRIPANFSKVLQLSAHFMFYPWG
jgi:hypothetical protein